MKIASILFFLLPVTGFSTPTSVSHGISAFRINVKNLSNGAKSYSSNFPRVGCRILLSAVGLGSLGLAELIPESRGVLLGIFVAGNGLSFIDSFFTKPAALAGQGSRLKRFSRNVLQGAQNQFSKPNSSADSFSNERQEFAKRVTTKYSSLTGKSGATDGAWTEFTAAWEKDPQTIEQINAVLTDELTNIETEYLNPHNRGTIVSNKILIDAQEKILEVLASSLAQYAFEKGRR